MGSQEEGSWERGCYRAGKMAVAGCSESCPVMEQESTVFLGTMTMAERSGSSLSGPISVISL